MDVATVRQILARHPIIPAVRARKNQARIPKGGARCVFLLESTLLDLADCVGEISAAGHVVFVHADLVEGLKMDTVGMRFLAEHVRPHGVISTHRGVLENARKTGLMRILRVFMLDSEAVEKGRQLVSQVTPDFVEMLPGIAVPAMPETILHAFRCPLIAGGLVRELKEVHEILTKGACGVSTSQSALW